MDDDVLERVTRSQPRPMSDDPAVSGEFVILVHCDGFSIVEAASVLGIRASTARGRYQRATIRLRKSSLRFVRRRSPTWSVNSHRRISPRTQQADAPIGTRTDRHAHREQIGRP